MSIELKGGIMSIELEKIEENLITLEKKLEKKSPEEIEQEFNKIDWSKDCGAEWRIS